MAKIFGRYDYDPVIVYQNGKAQDIYQDLRVDSLLQIHALHNFMEIKKISEPTIALCLEQYEVQYNSLEWKYLSTYSSTLMSVMSSYTVALDKTNTETGDNLITIMSEALCCLHVSEASVLINKILEECVLRFGHTNTKLAEIQSTHSLLYVIDLWFTKLKDNLTKIKDEISGLKYFTENVKSRNQVCPVVWKNIMELVQSVYDCHLRVIMENEKTKKKRSNTPKCKMCIVRNKINNFECLLFDKVIDKISNVVEGAENPSFEMFLCKLSFSFLKSKQSQPELFVALEKCWLYLENLQTVCKRLTKLWIEMEYTIKAYDELNMCKMRISLTEDVDDKSTYKVFEHEIDQRIVDHQNDLFSAEKGFVRKLARLRYINHLKNDEEVGACPICHLVEHDRYAVLECGHHICLQCLQSVHLYSKSSTLKCSVCRNVQQNRDVYYVSRSNAKNQEDDPIKGNYSSKITNLVRLVLKLQKQKFETASCAEPFNINGGELKILIFSQWMPILKAIAFALKENDIAFRIQCTPKTLEDFKNPRLGITCLLMPFTKGSKGLNLIEATHVFLVEPILNPGEELQAIGRVHRFGQKRATTIHRFIMSDSIEENIFNFVSSSSVERNGASNNTGSKWEYETVSLDDFLNLFTLKTNNGYN